MCNLVCTLASWRTKESKFTYCSNKVRTEQRNLIMDKNSSETVLLFHFKYTVDLKKTVKSQWQKLEHLK